MPTDVRTDLLTDLRTDLMIYIYIYMDLQCFSIGSMISIGFVQSADRLVADLLIDLLTGLMTYIDAFPWFPMIVNCLYNLLTDC